MSKKDWRLRPKGTKGGMTEPVTQLTVASVQPVNLLHVSHAAKVENCEMDESSVWEYAIHKQS